MTLAPASTHRSVGVERTGGSRPDDFRARADRIILIGFGLAYLIVGSLGSAVGAFLLVDREFSASLLPRLKPFLETYLDHLDELALPFASAAGLCLLIGGALLIAGGALVSFLERKERRV